METLYYNGTILTMNETCDFSSTISALLTKDGKIVDLGTLKVLKAKAPKAHLVDLEGHTMLPGFIDAHSHITNQLNTYPSVAPETGVLDVPTLINRLKEHFKTLGQNAGDYFIAIGYDEAYYPDKTPPTRHDLNQVSKTIPIIVYHKSLHLAVANDEAMRRQAITKNTPNPHSGIIQREVDGHPNGIFEEKALDLLGDFLFGLVGEIKDLLPAFYKTQQYYASFGITTAQDGASSKAYLKLLEAAQKADKLILDVYAYPLLDGEAECLPKTASQAQVYHKHLKILGGKIVADGSPQAKTAWLSQPYFIPPRGESKDYRGYPLYSDEEMVNFMVPLIQREQQILCHCNGDAMADQFIRTYKLALAKTACQKNLRPVMIHAQTVREDQLDEIANLGMIASFFHDHVYYWGEHHRHSSLGEARAQRISPLKSALNRGILLTLHQDTPIIAPDMIRTLHTAVNRHTHLGHPLGEAFSIPIYEALKAITINASYQAFDETIKGSLAVGKLADFVILSDNPLTIPKTAIKTLKVLKTIKEDKVIYEAP